MSDSSSSTPIGATGAGGGDMLRITGLNTGLDIDSIVKKMLKGDQAKLDKVKQSQQLIQWRQDAYKSIISDIQDLQKSFFDVNDMANYLLNTDNYSNMNATSDTDALVSATAQTGAAAGTYKISVSQVAKNAVISGSASLSSQAELHTVQGWSGKTLTFNDGTSDIPISIDSSFSGNIDDLVTTLNSKINNSTLNGKLSVSNDNGKIKFTNPLASPTITLKDGSGVTDIPTGDHSITISSPYETTAINQNQDFSGWKKTITFSIGDTSPATTATLDLTQFNGSTASDLVSYINSKITANSSLTGKISASYVKSGNDEYINFMPLDSDSDIKIVSNTGHNNITDATDITDLSSLISSGKNLVSASKNTRLTDLGSGLNGKIVLNLNYNGKEVSVEVDNSSSGKNGSATVGDLITAISSATGGAVTGKFEDTTGKFTLQTTATGSISDLKIEKQLSTYGHPGDTSQQTTTNLLSALKISTTTPDANGNYASSQGRDAEVKITGIDGTQTTMTESSNSFTVNGINYNVTGVTSSDVSISVTSDTSKIYNKISDFIGKYNKVVDEIHTKLNEKGDKDYPPLTDSKKSSMNSDDIKNYEAKAKQGILRNDQNLENLLYGLRSAFSSVVQDGNGNSVASVTFGRYGTNAIGVDLSNDVTQPDELTIADSSKLKEAIANHGDQVLKLFTTKFNAALNNRYNIAGSDLSGWGGTGKTIDLQTNNTDVNIDMSGFTGTTLDSLATYINDKIKSTALKDIVSVSVSVDASNAKHIKFTTSKDVYMKATGISDLPTSSTKMLSDKDAEFNQSGIFSRVKDIFDDNVGVVGTSLNIATLTHYANYQEDFSIYGGTGDTLPDQIYQKQQQIKDLTDQMTNDEKKYYNQFTNLEVAMQQLNSQQAVISSYFSS